MVEELFKAWDFNGDGVIDRSKLETSDLEVGPMKAKVFRDFEKMDLDKDNVVTLDEMLTYFGVVSALMSEAEFRAGGDGLPLGLRDRGLLDPDLTADNAFIGM